MVYLKVCQEYLVKIMKLYVLKDKINIVDGRSEKSFHPFILANEQDSHLFENGNYELIDTVFNINEIKNIQEEIKDFIDKFYQKIDINKLNSDIKNIYTVEKNIKEQLEYLQNMKNSLDKSIQTLNNMEEKIHITYNSMLNNITINLEKYENIVEESKDSQNKMFTYIQKIEKEAGRDILSKYINIKEDLDKEYKKIINELRDIKNDTKLYMDMSRKWAVNPLNIPVGNGEYSAKHYALLLQGRFKEKDYE